MKANEAPEKIYLFESLSGDSLSAKWLPKRLEYTDIEYTRTDVFIEKACEYINKLIDIPHNIECADNGEPLANSYIDYAKERLEVDLDKMLTEFMGRYAYENGEEYPSAIDIAKHFFELGLKVQKGD